MGAKKQTIGYRYFFSLHMGLGRGPFNEIAEIRVGGSTAYENTGDLSKDGKLIRINKPELFGGDQKEGGIQGPCYIYNGKADQTLQPAFDTPVGRLPSIAASLGGDVPAFRGVVTLWFNGLVAALNPYPKEWAFRVRRTTAGWFNDQPWYPDKATVTLQSENGGNIKAMNGAHILYEVNTNPEWGRGMPADQIDENSYIAAANQLCNEGFGLCIPWFRQENIKEFVPVVINHIGAVQYVSRETGKMTLRLIRGDYDPADLPLFTPDTGLLDILDDDSSGEETAYNEIIVTGFDPTTKEDFQVRVHNLASIQSQGEIISNSIEYRGLPTRALAGRVALRELKVQQPLRRMSVRLDRRGWRIAPGMPFAISYPEKGIGFLVLRAGEVSDGTLKSGEIVVKAVQDVFSMPATSFIEPPASEWTPPSFTAAPSPETQLYEINYRDYYRRSTPAERDAIDAGTSYIAELAKDVPNVQTQGFDIATKATGEEYQTYTNGGFTAWLTLAAGLTPLADTLEFAPENVEAFLSEFTDGMVVMIDEEQIQFTSFDEVTRIATLERGVADTIPDGHIAGATIWLIDDEMVSDGREYQDGETVYAKALVRTSTDLLDISAAEEDSIVVDQRVYRPFPPGNVRVGGKTIYGPLGVNEEPVVTWAHRDRVVQADTAVGHGAGSVGPEPGTTYEIKVFAEDGVTLLRTVDAGLVDTWTYTAAMKAEDAYTGKRIVVELRSKRDDVTSFFGYRFTVMLSGGWGYSWGLNWSG